MIKAFTILGRSLMAAALAAFLGAGIAGAGGCGSATGGSEAGNPSRSIVGSLAASPNAALTVGSTSLSSQAACPADTIVAVDSRKQEWVFPVASDCSFELELFFNKAYSIRFRLGDIDVGSMIFHNSPDRFPSPVMEIAEESVGISLGTVVVDDGQSLPENEPAAQNDADLDGLPDLEDPDDDNDGILDIDEPDCDLDGITDDFDARNTDCLPVSTLPDNTVLEVLPRNGSGITTPEDAVPLDRAVQARFSCSVDAASVNGETFFVTAKDAPDSVLQCGFVISEEGTTATCEPVGLVPDTAYQATIRSLRCKNGAAIAETTWEWRTTTVSTATLPVAVPTAPVEKIPE
ncbi:MAG TPA: Ig-like domain-containing protein [bacterium]|nr:Ig-like domain-containing protein [bacterium]